jgi:putative lumazine-binding protein
MKTACLGILSFTFAVTSIHALAQDSVVLAPIDAMFQGMTDRNPAAIKAAALPGTTLILMRDGKPEQMTIEAFAEHLNKPSKTHIEERIHDPLVRIDNDLAMVWAPFEFLVDGTPDHCGTDLFNLVKIDDKWLIAGIADTGTKQCASGKT